MSLWDKRMKSSEQIRRGVAFPVGLLFFFTLCVQSADSIYWPDDSGYTNVKDMGAKGDGIADDTAAIKSAYAKKGDSYRVYEINPQVIELANTEFSYLKDAEAPIEIALGDARLSLEREPIQNFDVLTIDAFSGDAVPVHLLNQEAFALYWKHMKPNGVLAVHISNKYLELKPVVAASAASAGKRGLVIEYDESDDPGEVCFGSTWVLVMSQATANGLPELVKRGEFLKPDPNFRTWTDGFSNMFGILRK